MAKIIIGIITVMLLIGVATGQVGVKDVPIVSDKAVEPGDTIRIVDKDEHQRIVDKTTLRIQRLENRVSVLESEISDLKDEIEGG